MSLFRSGAMAGSGLGSKIRTKLKKRKISVCPIVFGRSSLGVFHGYLTECVTNKHDDLVGIALLEAVAGHLICFGESDDRP